MRASGEAALDDRHDEQLLVAAAEGDAAAWAVLVDRHCELVWTTAVQLVGGELGGVVSELVWLRLASCLGGQHLAGGPRAWLRQAVWDECARQRDLHGLPPADG
jgi:hypothetical protein